MKKSIFLPVFTLLMAVNMLILQIFAAADFVVAAVFAEEGKSIYALKAGDVVTVSIALPEIDDVTKFEIDLKFDESVVEYNRDAALGNFAEDFELATVAQIADYGEPLPVIRLVAGATEPLSFPGGKVAFTASFTVKEGALAGDAVPFTMENFHCDDESVSLFKKPTTITIVGEESSTSDETTAAPEDGRAISTYEVVIAVCAAVAVIAVVLIAVKLRGKRI